MTAVVHDHGARRDRLRARLRERDVAALLVTSAVHVRYLAGFTGTNGQLLVGPDHDLLITDARYEGRAEVEAPDLDRVLDRDWIGAALRAATDTGLDRVGFEAAHVDYRTGTELVRRLRDAGVAAPATTNAVEALRAVKDDSEIDLLGRACDITGRALDAVVEQVRPGWTERDVAGLLERRMLELGADGIAFPSIVAGGPNSAVPHHQAGSRAVETGDLLKLDFGAVVQGYHADMTRTLAVGDPGPRLRGVHDLVRVAQQAAVDAVTPGVAATAVDRAARGVIETGGHGERFVHGTGHGVGLEIHEAPWVNPDSSDTLAANAVATVEPGVYLPGVGGVRIEDTVAVTPRGAVRLTTPPRELLVL